MQCFGKYQKVKLWRKIYKYGFFDIFFARY